MHVTLTAYTQDQIRELPFAERKTLVPIQLRQASGEQVTVYRPMNRTERRQALKEARREAAACAKRVRAAAHAQAVSAE